MLAFYLPTNRLYAFCRTKRTIYSTSAKD
uniref:Uncharacterized protein n=1 Tax=Arundo donax TaxID=35708 RepID=A0A0A9D613_ARUDO